MPFDETLAKRVRPLLSRRKGFAGKKMFGGMGYLLNGNMCCGVWKESLILRIGRDAYEEALTEPFVKEFDITGRPMTGWVMVEPEGIEDDQDLKDWVRQAIRFTSSLPAKEGSG